MKVKERQWARTYENDLFEVGLIDNENELIYGAKGGIYLFDNIFKVADTPQDLVQEEDLVEFNGRFRLIREIQDDTFYINYIDGFLKQEITAIYTPNEDKTQYTEQWRKK